MAKPKRICSIPDCGKKCYAWGWCAAHHYRWKRHGDPLGGHINHGDVLKHVEKSVIPYAGDDCLSWPFASQNGRGKLWAEGKLWVASRYVCTLVHGKPPTPKHHAAHSCGNGHLGCVTPKHLSWKTAKENDADKAGHGTSLVGERNNMAKLSEAEVLAIYALKGTLSQRLIAAQFKVDQSHISEIHSGKRWGWLTA